MIPEFIEWRRLLHFEHMLSSMILRELVLFVNNRADHSVTGLQIGVRKARPWTIVGNVFNRGTESLTVEHCG